MAAFDYLSCPNMNLLRRSLDLLFVLKLIDSNGDLTAKGHLVAESPLQNIFLGTMVTPSILFKLVNSPDFACSDEILTICSFLTVGSCFMAGPSNRYEEIRAKFGVEEGDLISFINAYQGFLLSRKSIAWCNANFIDHKLIGRIYFFRQVLESFLRRKSFKVVSCGSNLPQLQKCIVSAYFVNVGRLMPDGSYCSPGDSRNKLFIHPTSFLSKNTPSWILFTEIEDTSKPFVKNVLAIDPMWLPEVASSYFRVV